MNRTIIYHLSDKIDIKVTEELKLVNNIFQIDIKAEIQSKSELTEEEKELCDKFIKELKQSRQYTLNNIGRNIMEGSASMIEEFKIVNIDKNEVILPGCLINDSADFVNLINNNQIFGIFAYLIQSRNSNTIGNTLTEFFGRWAGDRIILASNAFTPDIYYNKDQIDITEDLVQEFNEVIGKWYPKLIVKIKGHCELCGKIISECDVCMHQFKNGDPILCQETFTGGRRHYCSPVCYKSENKDKDYNAYNEETRFHSGRI